MSDNPTVSFVFSVFCNEREGEDGSPRPCNFDPGSKLNAFKNRKVKSIMLRELGPEYPDPKTGTNVVPDRLQTDPSRLILKDLDVYIGPPAEHQQITQLPTDGRYASPVIVGVAEGSGIFTKSFQEFNGGFELIGDELAQAHKDIKKWEIMFNFFLSEIFNFGGTYLDDDGQELTIEPYIEIPNLDELHPTHTARPDPNSHYWYAVWTIFVVKRDDVPVEEPYVMSGAGGC